SFNLAITPGLAHAGIEYPSLVMQGEETLGIVTNHEVAHQWFYSLVGSNPAREPWLDEGLTTYAQSRIDSQIDILASEPVPDPARNRLGAGMRYWDGHQDVYFQGVYAQGVKALAAVGPPDVIDCGLRRYVSANAYSIADSSDLIRALEAEAAGAGRILGRFGVRS
ncbi:MAG: M1 family aminopeptidase, partial [Actinomycetota bacterium]